MQNMSMRFHEVCHLIDTYKLGVYKRVSLYAHNCGCK